MGGTENGEESRGRGKRQNGVLFQVSSDSLSVASASSHFYFFCFLFFFWTKVLPESVWVRAAGRSSARARWQPYLSRSRGPVVASQAARTRRGRLATAPLRCFCPRLAPTRFPEAPFFLFRALPIPTSAVSRHSQFFFMHAQDLRVE